MTIAEKYGYFEHKDGIEMGLPVRFERRSRGVLGLIPFWPFTRRPFQVDVAIYKVKLHPSKPLQYVCGRECEAIGFQAGSRLQICREMETDLGSIPPILQGLVSKDSFPCSYIHHDGAYERHGLWLQGPHGGTWNFQPLTREQADKLLYVMVVAEGGSRATAGLIYTAVNLGGWAVW